MLLRELQIQIRLIRHIRIRRGFLLHVLDVLVIDLDLRRTILLKHISVDREFVGIKTQILLGIFRQETSNEFPGLLLIRAGSGDRHGKLTLGTHAHTIQGRHTGKDRGLARLRKSGHIELKIEKGDGAAGDHVLTEQNIIVNATVHQKQFVENTDLYVTKYITDTNIYEVSGYNPLSYNKFCSDIENDDNAEKTLNLMSEEGLLEKRYPTLVLKRKRLDTK